jgi:hypothetical protein
VCVYPRARVCVRVVVVGVLVYGFT